MPFLKVHDQNGVCLINVDHVAYMQTSGNYTEIRLANSAKSEVNVSLASFEEQLIAGGYQVIEVKR